MSALSFERAGKAEAAAYRDIRLQALLTDPDAYLDSFATESTKPITYWEATTTQPNRAILLGYSEAEPTQPAGVQNVDISSKGSALLHGLYVRPQFRGNRYAYELIQAGIEFAKESGAHTVRTSTLYSNERALHILEKSGFTVETGKLVDLPRYTKHFGEYALSMSLVSVHEE